MIPQRVHVVVVAHIPPSGNCFTISLKALSSLSPTEKRTWRPRDVCTKHVNTCERPSYAGPHFIHLADHLSPGPFPSPHPTTPRASLPVKFHPSEDRAQGYSGSWRWPSRSPRCPQIPLPDLPWVVKGVGRERPPTPAGPLLDSLDLTSLHHVVAVAGGTDYGQIHPIIHFAKAREWEIALCKPQWGSRSALPGGLKGWENSQLG